jgi:hypothetical protein
MVLEKIVNNNEQVFLGHFCPFACVALCMHGAWLFPGFPAAVADLRFVLNAYAWRAPLGMVLPYDRDLPNWKYTNVLPAW